MLDLYCFVQAFSSCGEQGLLFVAVCGLLIAVASLVAEHRPQAHRLSSWGTWAQLLRNVWNLPGPGIKPVSPALAGRFLSTVPPGKYHTEMFLIPQSSHCPSERHAGLAPAEEMKAPFRGGTPSSMDLLSLWDKHRRWSSQWLVFMVCVHEPCTWLPVPGSLGLGAAVHGNCLGKPAANYGVFGDQ